MEQTHKFTLPSGIDAEVKDMDGSHQRLLTEKKKGKTFTDRLDELLGDLVVRVGSTTKITSKFLKAMLNADKAKLLIEIRQFTMEHDPTFTFVWKYKSEVTEKYIEYTHEEDLPDGIFPSKPVMVSNPNYGKAIAEGEPELDTEELIPAAYQEYDQVVKDCYTVLPRSGEKIRWTMLDGHAVARGSATPKNKLSSHTQIKLRNPVKFMKGGKDNKQDIAISLNLDKLKFKDIEHLRAEIKKVEGYVYTEIIFEHPEAELKGPNSKSVTVDVLGSSAFFFPSQAL